MATVTRRYSTGASGCLPRNRDEIAALPAQYRGGSAGVALEPSLREPAPQIVDICAAVARIPMAAPPRVRARSAQTSAPAAGQELAPGLALAAEAAAADLTRRAAEFPDHDITRETTLGGAHYVAQARDLSTHPW
jgi:hypothetical protein